jgi:hypothetical protein
MSADNQAESVPERKRLSAIAKIKQDLACLRGASSLRGRDSRVVRVFDVADLACDLGIQARALTTERESRSLRHQSTVCMWQVPQIRGLH